MLQAWDRSREEVVDLEIEWKKGHDVDARVRVPARFKKEWQHSVAVVRRDHRDGERVTPYPTLPISVPVSGVHLPPLLGHLE